MTMACKSGKHFWLDHDSALYCCNGYHRELRDPTDLFGTEDRGRVRVAGTRLISVWVKDAEGTADLKVGKTAVGIVATPSASEIEGTQ